MVTIVMSKVVYRLRRWAVVDREVTDNLMILSAYRILVSPAYGVTCCDFIRGEVGPHRGDLVSQVQVSLGYLHRWGRRG